MFKSFKCDFKGSRLEYCCVLCMPLKRTFLGYFDDMISPFERIKARYILISLGYGKRGGNGRQTAASTTIEIKAKQPRCHQTMLKLIDWGRFYIFKYNFVGK